MKDVTNKSLADVRADILRFQKLGAKLPAADQDLTDVCYIVSSMGKQVLVGPPFSGVSSMGKQLCNNVTTQCEYNNA